MTAVRRDGVESPFNAWVRSHPELESRGNRLSITDSDLWCHRYSMRDERHRESSNDVRDAVDSIMLVEVKTFLRDVPFAQRDTLTVIDALLRMASTRKSDGRRMHVKISDARLGGRKVRRVRCFGVHLLELSGDRPDNSETIMWDHRSYLHEEALIELLRFDRDPDSPMKCLDTRRHHVMRAPNPTFSLFVAGGSN